MFAAAILASTAYNLATKGTKHYSVKAFRKEIERLDWHGYTVEITAVPSASLAGNSNAGMLLGMGASAMTCPLEKKVYFFWANIIANAVTPCIEKFGADPVETVRHENRHVQQFSAGLSLAAGHEGSYWENALEVDARNWASGKEARTVEEVFGL